jgi:hypothetical protein
VFEHITGLGTGQGTWGTSNLQLTKLTTAQSRDQKQRDVPVLPASVETFVQAIELLAQARPCEVGLIGVGEGDTNIGSAQLRASLKRWLLLKHGTRRGVRRISISPGFRQAVELWMRLSEIDLIRFS